MPMKDPSDASVAASAVVVLVPLILVAGGSYVVSQMSATERMVDNKRWEVARVRPQGDKTALELRSKQEDLKIDMTVPTGTARSQKLQVRDELDIEAIGKAGYAVRKGATTIGILTQPGSGMVHSKPR
jgi:hypothetical protein